MEFCQQSLLREWTFHDVRNQMRDGVFRRVEEALGKGDRERDAISCPEDVRTRQEFVRQKLLDALGGLPEKGARLNARTTGTQKADGFQIEKVLFEARPGAQITANFYLPDRREGKIPAVLFLCGHTEDGKTYPFYQNVCQRLVRGGMAVLAMDPVGQGERFEYFEPETGGLRIPGTTAEHDYAGKPCWLLGDSLARYFLADAMGGIDYLCSRDEVDPERIGVTGNSGGGTQTSLVMLADRRIAAAAPGTFLTSGTAILRSGKAQDAEQIWPGLTKLGIDHEDILLAAAPRPVLVLGVEYDFFPMDGTARTVERARRYWDILGNPNWPILVTDRCEHQYSDPLARRAAAFFAEVFGLSRPPETAPRLLKREELECVPGGQLLREYPNTATIQKENAKRARELEERRRKSAPEIRRREAEEWLREQVFRDRKPTPFYLRCVERTLEDGIRCWKCLWAAEEGRLTTAAAFRSAAFDGQKLPVTVAVWDDGTRAAAEHEDWIRETCARGRIVLVADPLGVGAVRPYPLGGEELSGRFGTMYVLASELIRLGDSLCAMRCYDVLRAVEMAGEFEDASGEDTELYGCGAGSVYAKIAALLAPRRTPVQAEKEFGSFSELVQTKYYATETLMEILLPGILHHLDTGDLDSWNI